ncbi:integral er membrane protein [Apiospora arundinis]
MSVEIDPQELGFHRPFTVEVSETLKIRNPNTQPVAFKVKTTAPKQYCVRPNSGRVEPGKEVEVQVILQAMKTEPPLDTRCRDKFLVQSVPITSDKEFSNLTAIWDSIDKSQVVEKKIRVVFLSPRGTAGAVPSQLETPKRNSTVNGTDATPDSEDIKEDAGSPSVLANAAAAASTAATATYEELKVQLEKAQQTISQLKQDQGGLRQRKTGAGEEKSAPAQLAQQVRQGTEGVPIQMTAILCLLSFLLAYLFF